MTAGSVRSRNFSEIALQAGAFGVSLLGEGSRFLPVDYVSTPAEGTSAAWRQVLADSSLVATRTGSRRW